MTRLGRNFLRGEALPSWHVNPEQGYHYPPDHSPIALGDIPRSIQIDVEGMATHVTHEESLLVSGPAIKRSFSRKIAQKQKNL